MHSAPSTFSMRDCSLHKRALGRESMVDVLVKCCDAMTEFNHCLQRWMKLVVDEIIEKGKSPRMKKLRTLEIAEECM